MESVYSRQHTVDRGQETACRRRHTVGSRQVTGYRIQGRADMDKKIQRFEDLGVWQKAHKVVLETYKITKDFPGEEKFGLVSQMRRSAVSIAANIAEGFKKRSPRDKVNFYNIAQGSLEELRYYMILAKDLAYTNDTAAILSVIDEVGKMLHSLINSVSGR